MEEYTNLIDEYTKQEAIIGVQKSIDKETKSECKRRISILKEMKEILINL